MTNRSLPLDPSQRLSVHHTQTHHTPADGGGEVGGGKDGGDEGGLGIGGGVTSPLTKVTIWSPHVHETLGNTPKKELFVL